MVVGDINGFGDIPQRGFAADHSLDAYTQLFRLVLASYGYRCALTGAQFGPATALLHPDLDVVAIQPLADGGILSISNCLPMIASLVQPFREGLIAVDDDFRIVVPQPQLLGAEVVSALRARLFVPAEPQLQPDVAFLGHHRRFALGR